MLPPRHQFSDRQMCHCGMTDGAIENVTPIHSPEATEASTEIAAPVVQCDTEVWLDAVATAPPLSHLPVASTVELAPGRPIERKITRQRYRNGAVVMLGTTVCVGDTPSDVPPITSP